MFTSGLDSYALSFNGTTNYAAIVNAVPNFDMLNHAKDFTVCGWVKPAVLTGRRAIVTKAAGGPAFTMPCPWFPAGLVRRWNSSTAPAPTPAASSRWPTAGGMWRRLSPSRNVKLYIDGVQVGINQIAPGDAPQAGTQVDIGRLGGSTPTDYFSGVIDNVRVYATTLTPATWPGHLDDQKINGYWKLNETSGTTAAEPRATPAPARSPMAPYGTAAAGTAIA